ncbi:MAG: hypothetical protein AB1430_10985 [Pseudomonadota bacterium]
MTPPWTPRAWPPVLWQADSTDQLQFSHLGTRILICSDCDQPSAGQTFWGSPLGDSEAGVAWDWVQVLPGILAIADPMCMVTNLRFTSREGTVLTAWEAARHLNDIVHSLPWQDEVWRALTQQSSLHATVPAAA